MPSVVVNPVGSSATSIIVELSPNSMTVRVSRLALSTRAIRLPLKLITSAIAAAARSAKVAELPSGSPTLSAARARNSAPSMVMTNSSPALNGSSSVTVLAFVLKEVLVAKSEILRVATKLAPETRVIVRPGPFAAKVKSLIDAPVALVARLVATSVNPRGPASVTT